MDDIRKYEKIIGLPHHVSERHPRMSAAGRAAQFAPFAALSGYGASVAEAGRLTDEKTELGESDSERLDRRLRLIAERIKEQPEVTVTYFRSDEKKAGGAEVRKTGRIKRIDEVGRALVFTDKTEILIDDVYGIDSDIFAILCEEE